MESAPLLRKGIDLGPVTRPIPSRPDLKLLSGRKSILWGQQGILTDEDKARGSQGRAHVSLPAITVPGSWCVEWEGPVLASSLAEDTAVGPQLQPFQCMNSKLDLERSSWDSHQDCDMGHQHLKCTVTCRAHHPPRFPTFLSIKILFQHTCRNFMDLELLVAVLLSVD